MTDAARTSPRDRQPAVMALQGWVCDRYTQSGMEGAAVLARLVAAELGVSALELGTPEAAADLGWQASLAKAAPYLRDVSSHLEAVMSAQRLPLLFANRCGASIATIATALRHRPDAAIVWCDAHADFNTPDSTPTGYLGGMVLTALCGLWESGFGAGLTPDRIVLVAPRDIDEAEKVLIDRHGVRVVAAPEGRLEAEAVAAAASGRPVWLHIDTDVVDPAALPAEYRVAGGVLPAMLKAMQTALLSTSELVGFELTEFEVPPPGLARERATEVILDMIAPVLDICRRAN